ncbi:nitroreductase [Rhizobium leguminosarum]|uniref:nitroreductase n=1 Tax=Rhizobium leguminosarum TaxID=384 RepID=UPI00143FAEF4|nr:nitroreductase [Rhizobium leguminosarum]MBY5779403.1 nitroreductase [Rhizobium leguminosarum]MBY5827496.1 nitroreductase [Rhizobium leguminosarum]NKM65112.1 nitroreductase [Rhizobium leguminosarum bv. viciae]
MHANLTWDKSDIDRATVVDQIMMERRAKRGFLNTPIPTETVNEILNAARFAPSSSNTQPWRCYVLTGSARDRITSKAVEIFRAGPEKLAPEYPFFPQPLHDPFIGRFNQFRGQLGDAVGVPRSDKYGRLKDVERQFRFFEAPVGMIFTMDRKLEWASFICYGCFLQSLMLAAKARGLDTCAQQIWSLQHQLLREELGFPETDMVIAGMSLGWADNALPENNMVNQKLAIEDFVEFVS